MYEITTDSPIRRHVRPTEDVIEAVALFMHLTSPSLSMRTADRYRTALEAGEQLKVKLPFKYHGRPAVLTITAQKVES